LYESVGPKHLSSNPTPTEYSVASSSQASKSTHSFLLNSAHSTITSTHFPQNSSSSHHMSTRSCRPIEGSIILFANIPLACANSAQRECMRSSLSGRQGNPIGAFLPRKRKAARVHAASVAGLCEEGRPRPRPRCSARAQASAAAHNSRCGPHALEDSHSPLALHNTSNDNACAARRTQANTSIGGSSPVFPAIHHAQK